MTVAYLPPVQTDCVVPTTGPYPHGAVSLDLDPTTRGWIVGLIEGEGCISNTATYGITIAVVMTDHDVLERLAKIIPGSRLGKPFIGSRGKKPVRQWRLSKRGTVVAFLNEIYPLMGARRQQRIREAFERMNTPRKKPGPVPRIAASPEAEQMRRSRERRHADGRLRSWDSVRPVVLRAAI